MAADPWEPPAACGDGSALSRADDAFGFDVPPTSRLQEGDTLPPGTDLGGVIIVRLLADGGMGRVYEARQSEPDRTVAVKVLRGAFASDELIRRFRYEARVLARLQHPAIAQIHTFGTFGVGAAPFFVMELIEGARPITRYVAERRLGIREVVSLLHRVCGAVAHGHQKGVIHRDLKPGNLLVDAAGIPKVIDFGVARSLESGPAGETQFTRAGDRVGTLRYMSPEQLGGGDVDARSDVYALGLVLHEMLVGHLPYDLASMPFVDAVRMLGDPQPASTSEIVRVARTRGVPAGDARSLATVAATCLAKDPAQRYATAVELEAELGRWLAGDAILARPPTAAESIVRFARRHRAAALSAAAVLASLIAAVTATSVFFVRAEQQRRLAENARRLAERREQDAEGQTAAARAQLYVSNVLLAAAARDRDNVPEARKLIAEARELSGVADTATPLELACISATLDDSLSKTPLDGGTVTALGWSPDGSVVAGGAEDGGVRLGRLDGGGVAWTAPPLGRHDGRVWSTTFAPGGDLLASAAADGTVRLWSISDRTPVTILGVTEAATYATAFSPDGRFLATGGRDRVVRVWDTATWQLHGELTGHKATVLSACFLGDRATLATA
ncbi:MAG: WD40 repeat domain-containing serine/threonine protein kinase, partial [Planctomycetota bacterium]